MKQRIMIAMASVAAALLAGCTHGPDNAALASARAQCVTEGKHFVPAGGHNGPAVGYCSTPADPRVSMSPQPADLGG